MSLLGAPATPVHPCRRENLHSQGLGERRVGREKLANSFDVLFWCASIFLAESVDQEEVRNVRRDEKA